MSACNRDFSSKGAFLGALFSMVGLNVLISHIVGYMWAGGTINALWIGLGLGVALFFLGVFASIYEELAFGPRAVLTACSVGCMAACVLAYLGWFSPTRAIDGFIVSSAENVDDYASFYTVSLRNYLLWTSIAGFMCTMAAYHTYIICPCCESGVCCDMNGTNCMPCGDSAFTAAIMSEEKPIIPKPKRRSAKRSADKKK